VVAFGAFIEILSISVRLMRQQYLNKSTGGELHLIQHEDNLDRFFYGRDQKKLLFSLAWNKGAAQQVIIDEVPYICPSNALLPLMIHQSFRFGNSKDIVAWQFNREFYCMADHDREVGCVGFLFFGNSHIPILHLEKEEQVKFQNLLNVFQEEFEIDDLIKGDMLLMLLKRLIIKATRLAKSQYLTKELEGGRLDVIRNFNLLVETHFRKQHSVQFYAAEMNKSPKTLSNLFGIYNHKSPLEVIQGRLVLEAKRLFYYTDKSAKEVGYELGFEDPGHFSRFFKNDTGLSPSQFKKSFKVV
jgi:AraC family transcriptional regulator, transcriptional activator of pobA